MESEMLISIPEVILSCNGRRMPLLGMGTATSPLVSSDEIKAVIVQAIEVGYRHFDTATLYLTEEPLGEAIAEALSRGLIQSRDDLFITTKLWCSDAHPDLVIPALNKSLKALQLEYIDLYVVHWPVSSRPGIYEYPIKKEDFLPMDFKGVWGAMEECYKQGLTKSIGVSNFSCKKLSEIIAIAEIPPAVNQVEINPIWQQKKQMEFCKSNGIVLAAYAPLGGLNNKVMENEVLKEIAAAKGKSTAQICLRWAYEQGVCVLVKSFNKERMRENLDIFNWTLSEEETKKISEIPQQRGQTGQDYISEDGPYKSLEDLWDGEI
ncbi:NAD(P)-linked oxidoreductase superfamily protein [Euphorbia peplus]|nr:NAD(P)-linked oxidoreductase superfamily protein [Euphorbia peplus]